jgi:TonB-linked SusC/RagA family outer membrane protein
MKNFIQIILIIILPTIIPSETFSQAPVISGRVYDKADSSVIIGATIVEYDRESRVINGTVSDATGNFVIRMSNPANDLIVSFIGYGSQAIDTEPGAPRIIYLVPAIAQFEEVVVTAQARSHTRLTNIEDRDIASSTARIDLTELRGAGFTSATEALQGQVSGLDIISASGDPGSGAQIVIRGLSSMGNSRPLIVIDGIPQQRVSADFDLSSADSEDISNLINIALQDIKSIEVFKDAASTAIYGSSGADGVLLIETHRGRMGRVQFDYQYRNSVNFQPSPIPMLNGDEYVTLQLEQLQNAFGVFVIPVDIAYDTENPNFYNYSANTDWIRAITRNSLTHDHYFNVSGGGQKTRYFTSFSYIDESGTSINTSSEKFSTRINLDYFLSRKFVFTTQFNYYSDLTDRNAAVLGRNIREMAFIKAPNMSIFEYDAKGNLTGNYFTPITSYQGSGVNSFNPVAVADLGKDTRKMSSMESTFKIRYNLTEWLVMRGTVAIQHSGTKVNTFLPYNAIGSDWIDNIVNRSTEVNSVNTSVKTETQLAFNVPFNSSNHELSGAFNWITNESSLENTNIQGSRSSSAKIRDPSYAPQIQWMGNWSDARRELGALVNINYKYLDRYLLQSILRADAHSAFGISNRWGLFQGFSVGWRFSDESLFKSYSWLGESMLRASWGVSGSQPGDPYARFSIYESTFTGSYINNPAIVPTQIQLNRLQWETIKSLNLGLKMSMFKDRLNVVTDLYDKNSYDILFRRYEIPYSSGFNQLLFLNGGQLNNRGWEIMVDYRIIQRTNKLSWSVSTNASRNRNRFISLPDNFNTEQDLSIGNGQYPKRLVLGEAIGSFYGFEYLGVWASDQDVVGRDADGNIILDAYGNPVPLTYAGVYEFKGGDARYRDVNHDGKIDLNDVVYIGDSNPDFFGGFSTLFRYAGFSFSANFHYRVGFDIVNRVAINTQDMAGRNNQSKAVLYRWRTQGQDYPGMLPRAYMNHPANNLGSDRYVERGDFLRLSSIRIGYRFSGNNIKKLGIRNAETFLSARRLLTFTNYSGQDPEVSQNASNPFWIGEDRAQTPPPKMITLSVSLGF